MPLSIGDFDGGCWSWEKAWESFNSMKLHWNARKLFYNRNHFTAHEYLSVGFVHVLLCVYVRTCTASVLLSKVDGYFRLFYVWINAGRSTDMNSGGDADVTKFHVGFHASFRLLFLLLRSVLKISNHSKPLKAKNHKNARRLRVEFYVENFDAKSCKNSQKISSEWWERRRRRRKTSNGDYLWHPLRVRVQTERSKDQISNAQRDDRRRERCTTAKQSKAKKLPSFSAKWQ